MPSPNSSKTVIDRASQLINPDALATRIVRWANDDALTEFLEKEQ